MYDITCDIHGQAEQFRGLLDRLGWRRTAAGWQSDAPNRRIVFLGDGNDRGPENAAVLCTVRSLINAAKAPAVMGNHELNAIHFYTPGGGSDGTYLRPHEGTEALPRRALK